MTSEERAGEPRSTRSTVFLSLSLSRMRTCVMQHLQIVSSCRKGAQISAAVVAFGPHAPRAQQAVVPIIMSRGLASVCRWWGSPDTSLGSSLFGRRPGFHVHFKKKSSPNNQGNITTMPATYIVAFRYQKGIQRNMNGHGDRETQTVLYIRYPYGLAQQTFTHMQPVPMEVVGTEDCMHPAVVVWRVRTRVSTTLLCRSTCTTINSVG